VQLLASSLLEYYESYQESYSIGSSSFTPGKLMGTSQGLLFARINVVVVVSQRLILGCGLESYFVVIFFEFLDDCIVHLS